MLWNLYKIRLRALFASLFKGSRKKKKHSPVFIVLIGLFALYVVAAVLFACGAMCYNVCAQCCAGDGGFEWLYFAYVSMIIFVAGFILSIFTAKTELFEAKDNELLLSMPLKPSEILGSRMLIMLTSDMLVSAFVGIPAIVVYFMVAGSVNIFGIILYFLGMLMLPLLTVSLSAVVGWLVSTLTAKSRHKSLWTTVTSMLFMLAFIVLYYVFMGSVMTGSINMTDNADVFQTAYPFYCFGRAAGNGEILYFLLYVLMMIIPFAVMVFVISKFFYVITTGKHSAPKLAYSGSQVRTTGARRALVKREIKHFFTSPIYLMNCGIGLVFQLIIAGAAAVMSGKITEMLSAPEMSMFPEDLIPAGIIVVFLFCSSMIVISAPSISLEGNNLWISQSLPIGGSEILLSKVLAHITVAAPVSLLSSLIVSIFIPMNLYMIPFVFLVPLAMVVMIAFAGVTLNLWFPKFDWTDEVVPVKQGIAGILTILSGMATSLGPVFLYIFLLADKVPVWAVCADLLIIYSALSSQMYIYLKRCGDRKFAEL